MPWQLSEFLLKGTYLGLLAALAVRKPSWDDIAFAGLGMLIGLALVLGSVALQKLSEGCRIKGRALGFLLFLILDHPRKVFGGSILGLALGVYVPLVWKIPAESGLMWYVALMLAPPAGAIFGLALWFLRHVQAKVRTWLGLSLVVIPMTVASLLFYFEVFSMDEEVRRMIGYVVLLGIPGFYLLTFASLVEESEVEMAVMCGMLGAAVALILGPEVHFGTMSLVLPPAIYYFYTILILPSLRVFKHALRGMSYAQMGQYRYALASLNRALNLSPGHSLAREQMYFVHRQMDVEELKHDKETLALVNFDLCLERASSLLLLDKPTLTQIEEAERLLNLIADQRPALAPAAAYWRAVAFLHRRKFEEAAHDLESVLKIPERDSAQRRAILFQAWQLALMLHPEMKRRVGDPLLTQPAYRFEAIAAVERRLTIRKGEDPEAWDIKRLVYSEVTEEAYSAVVGEGTAAEFDHAYVQQLGLALVENPDRWQRGCEFLRIAARGLPAEAPAIFLQIGKLHEAHGDIDGLWQNNLKAIQAARAVGTANLKPDDREKLFAVVKAMGERAMAEGRLDEALQAFKFYTQFDRAGQETYRTLAELFERKGNELAKHAGDSELLKKEAQDNVWLALHCAEHGLSYDGKDQDFKERKDRYYYSIQPEEVKKRWEAVHLWFDVDYCLEKTRWLMEHYHNNLDLLDWADHLAKLASTAKPQSLTAKLLRARIHRARGEIAECVELLEQIRQNRPEKFASEEDGEAWFLTHRLLGDLYLDEKPDQAIACFQEFRKSDRSGADTLFKMGQAFETLGDFDRAARCYENVAAFDKHPLFYEARAALERVKRNPVA